MIRVLVTGSSGCIGAATVKYLLDHGADEVVGFTRRGAATDDAPPMPFVCDVDDSEAVRLFPDMPLTPLEEGIEQSLRFFSEMASTGKLTPADVTA